ncbi:MAG: nuclear transport factor 2 family protein [Leptolyngbyaceae cyanobacterium]
MKSAIAHYEFMPVYGPKINPTSIMIEQNKRDLIDRYLHAYNTFDIAGMLATLHPEVEFKNVSGGEVNATASGISEFAEMAQQSKALFTSRQQTMTAFEAADNDRVSINVAYEGVLAADLPNGMKAGEVLKLHGRTEFEFKDDRISRIADYS